MDNAVSPIHRSFGEGQAKPFHFVRAGTVIAVLTFLVLDGPEPAAQISRILLLALVAVWFGTSVAAREFIRERPYIAVSEWSTSEFCRISDRSCDVIGLIVGLQCLLFVVPLKFLISTGLMPMPGEWPGLPQLGAMLLTAAVGVALGLTSGPCPISARWRRASCL